MIRPIALTLLLAACLPALEPLPELLDEAPRIDAAAHWQVQVDAHLPNDLLLNDDGGFWVLDGYEGRAVVFNSANEATGTIGDAASWGHPVRMASAQPGGVWLVAPDGDLLRVGSDGTILQHLALTGTQPPHADTALVDSARPDTATPAPVHGAVAIFDAGDAIVIADRDGHLTWLSPVTGALINQVDAGMEEQPIGIITDITGWPDGGLLTVDTLEARIERRDDAGEATAGFGHFGLWVGYLRKPKAAAALNSDTVAIADSSLGAVQFFRTDGQPLGVLSEAGEPLRFEHPIALEQRDDWLYILDAGTSTVHGVQLAATALSPKAEATKVRWLRESLASPDGAVTSEDGELCLQCHDGLVQDSRKVWDPDLYQHPVNIIPLRELPEFFPLREDGAIECTTCHSPHGSTDPESAAEMSGDEERANLVRHSAPDSLFTRVSTEGSAICVACHTDAAHDGAILELGISSDGHPSGAALAKAMQKRGPDAQSELTEEGCLGCHSVHGAAEETLTRGLADGKLCAGCHAAMVRPVSNHPLGRPQADQPHPDGRLPLSDAGEVTCTTCHDLIGGGTALVRPTSASICLECHDERKSLRDGPHSKVKGRAGIACLGCHDIHENRADQLRTYAGDATDPNGCLECHGPGESAATSRARPGQWGHTVDGKSHDGMDEALSCMSCHDAHAPQGEIACQRCHETQGAARRRGGHGKTTCLDCHPAHSNAATFKANPDQANPASWVCLSCHAEGSGNADATAISDYQHPAPVFLPDGSRWAPLAGVPLFATDGSPAKAGENGDLTCASCHLTHGPDETKPGDNLRRPAWKSACAACHGEEALPLYRYFHKPERRVGLGKIEEKP